MPLSWRDAKSLKWWGLYVYFWGGVGFCLGGIQVCPCSTDLSTNAIDAIYCHSLPSRGRRTAGSCTCMCIHIAAHAHCKEGRCREPPTV